MSVTEYIAGCKIYCPEPSDSDDDDVEDDDDDDDGLHLVHPLGNSPQQGGGDAHSAEAHVLVQTSKVNYTSIYF